MVVVQIGSWQNTNSCSIQMTTPAEDRLWAQLFARLDNIDRKLETKVNYRDLEKLEKRVENLNNELESRLDRVDGELEVLQHAAISPDQVTHLISGKLQESEARGISKHERLVRYSVALVVGLTFAVTIYDKLS